ncbi:DUF3892 domain-containing protein [Acidicapsa dinghuensis]|uniref:DUF3892 domain-containing protein n=1 Tax=Acidicapsa dinghuensis TaxID=2218256 RepID=A0ABW1EJ03_9BACT
MLNWRTKGNAMKTILVRCKSKSAPEGRIEAVGGIDAITGAELRISEDEAIRQIEAGETRFIVRDALGHQAVVEVERREGRKFLITRRDGIITDNLGALPDCQPKPIQVSPPPYRPVQPARSHSVGADWRSL